MKLKINWGTAIVIAIVIMISGFIYLASIAIRQDYDLVEKDYYQQSINFQNRIEEEKNTGKLDTKIRFQQANDSLKLIFPNLGNPTEYQGKIHFYSPVSEKRDRVLSVSLKPDCSQTIDLKPLETGRYQVKIEWKLNQLSYYQEEEIRITR